MYTMQCTLHLVMLLTYAVDKHTMRRRSLSVSILEDNILERTGICTGSDNFFYIHRRTSRGLLLLDFDLKMVQVTKRIFVVDETNTPATPIPDEAAVRSWFMTYSRMSRQFNLFCRNFDTFLPIVTALSVKFDIVRIKQELKNV